MLAVRPESAEVGPSSAEVPGFFYNSKRKKVLQRISFQLKQRFLLKLSPGFCMFYEIVFHILPFQRARLELAD